MWSSLIGLGSSLLGLGGKEEKIANSVGEVIGAVENNQNQKVKGVPTPSGEEAGQTQLEFMNKAFPGTTPWERLGSGQGYGNVSNAEISARNQRNMQSREIKNQQYINQKTLDNQKEIAEKNNIASIINSMGAVTPKAATTMVDYYKNQEASKVQGYNTQTENVAKKIQSEVKNINADTAKKLAEKAVQLEQVRKTGSEADIARTDANFREAMNQAGLAEKWIGTVLNAVKTAFIPKATKAVAGAGRRFMRG